ncbi:hypothetical protein F383_01595 [Gossypium arboreum]|uniref:Uncharacterized protein n=1 Tax=Gossypium arboreum TaxID=29729 RepID=A0A0B0NTM0_GOSAR|nr:hypothetical protein F383_01595 [Gossypium arboreum]
MLNLLCLRFVPCKHKNAQICYLQLVPYKHRDAILKSSIYFVVSIGMSDLLSSICFL